MHSDSSTQLIEANKQHNYGIGKPKKMDETKCKAGLLITQWLLSNPKYRDVFIHNDLWKKDEKFIKEFQNDMASHIFDSFLAPFLQKDYKHLAQLYLTEILTENSEDPNEDS